ncbi:hypothetical protein OAR19_00645 [bacterium]|nr:hypothetical protein [bacterium]
MGKLKKLFMAIGLLLMFSTLIFAEESITKNDLKSVSKYLKKSGNFKKLFKKDSKKQMVICGFNVEYVYKRFKSRSTGQRGSETIKLSTETYHKLTDAIYDSFVKAVQEYGGLSVVAKKDVSKQKDYAAMGGKTVVDTKDAFISGKRAGDVRSTKEKGFESINVAATGLKMGGPFVKPKVYPRVTAELDSDICVEVDVMVDFDRKTDVPFIKKADVRVSSKLNKREKRIPFKGVVKGEYIYEFYGANSHTIGLKKPISTGVKVTDRRTGFFSQEAGSFNVDTEKMAVSILEAYKDMAIIQALALGGKS